MSANSRYCADMGELDAHITIDPARATFHMELPPNLAIKLCRDQRVHELLLRLSSCHWEPVAKAITCVMNQGAMVHDVLEAVAYIAASYDLDTFLWEYPSVGEAGLAFYDWLLETIANPTLWGGAEELVT